MSGSDLGKEGFGRVVGVDKLLDIVLGLGFGAGLVVLDNLLGRLGGFLVEFRLKVGDGFVSVSDSLLLLVA